MFFESHFERRDRISHPLPSELVDRLLSCSFTQDAVIFRDTYGDTLYRIFEGGEEYSGIPYVGLVLDYRERKYNDDREKSLSQLRFEYLDLFSKNDDRQSRIAQMHFDMIDKTHFELVHRYVPPERRRTGAALGTRLYRVAENYFSQVARRTHKPIFFSLQAGQKSVFAWAKEMGFSPLKSQQDLLREIDEHPERFFEDDVIVSEESQAQGIIKDRYIFPVGTTERYMDNGAIRLTFKKRILPDAGDSSGLDDAGVI